MIATLSNLTFFDFPALFGGGLLAMGVMMTAVGLGVTGSTDKWDAARALAWGVVSMIIGVSVFIAATISDGLILGLPSVQFVTSVAVVGILGVLMVMWTSRLIRGVRPRS